MVSCDWPVVEKVVVESFFLCVVFCTDFMLQVPVIIEMDMQQTVVSYDVHRLICHTECSLTNLRSLIYS